MKTLNSKSFLLVAIFTLLSVGCGKSNDFQGKSNANQPATSGGLGNVPNAPDGSILSSGTGVNTVNFIPVSIAEFNSYVALHPLNSPTEFKITIDLQNDGTNRYPGSVKLSYTDTGTQYVGNFESGSGTNQDLFKLKDAGMLEAEYNRWFLLNKKYYFSAFFQDAYGAIVVVIDNYLDQGDGQGGGTFSGSVYYKNFAQSYAPQSPYRKCWYVYSGPYTCRASAVIDKSAVYPADGYRKLGTFSGLSMAAVFHQ